MSPRTVSPEAPTSADGATLAARRRSRIRIALVVVLAAALIAAGTLAYIARQRANQTAALLQQTAAQAAIAAPLDGKPAPNFTLTDQFGKQVSLTSFRGKEVVWALIDSQCTTICPLTAQVLVQAKASLGRQANDVQLLAVNANPIATSVRAVRSWSASHNMLNQWLFVTGSAPQLKQVWKNYSVASTVVNGTVVHDPAIILIDPQGRQQLYYQSTEPQQGGASITQQAAALAQGMRKYLPAPGAASTP